MTKVNKILTIVTNASQFEQAGYRTGLWLSELTHFWRVVENAGYQVDIASPLGGKIPLDPQSLILTQIADAIGLGGDLAKRYKDDAFMNRLNNTLKIADADVNHYDAIYLVGGHGVMFDFPNDEALATLVAQFYENEKIVSSVCHGPAGLLNVTLSTGEYLVNKKKMTGFSWKEEKLAKRDQVVPFNLEEELKERGAHFSTAFLPFATHVIEDGLLITGQNPKSAKHVGKAVVKKLAKKR